MVSRDKDPRRITALLAVLVAIAALALGLAACGGGGDSGINGGDTESEEVKLEKKASGDVTISNWPLYIDKQTVPDFEKETGLSVKYIEDVNANEEFFAKMDPLLKQGESGGRSLFVVTDWMANKMHELGYLQNFDKSALPNFEKNLVSNLKEPSYDPQREFSAPWQSGMTGVIVRKDLAPDVKSVCDLFDPKYKGKIEMLNELRDTVPLVMKCLGIDPSEADEADWMKAIDKIKGAAESGQIRRFTGNDYGADLTSGNAVAVIGWSGDAVQLQADNPNIDADRGLHPLVGQHGDPGRGAEPDRGRGMDQLRLRAEKRGADRGLRQLRQPGRRSQRNPAQGRTGNRQEQADLPEQIVHEELHDPALAKRRRRTEPEPRLQRGAQRLSR